MFLLLPIYTGFTSYFCAKYYCRAVPTWGIYSNLYYQDNFLCAAFFIIARNASLALSSECFLSHFLYVFIFFSSIFLVVRRRWYVIEEKKNYNLLLLSFVVIGSTIAVRQVATEPLHPPHTPTHPPHSDPYRCFEPLAGPTRLSGPPSQEDRWDVGAWWYVHACIKQSVSPCV